MDGVAARGPGPGEDLAGLLAARERSDASADRFKGYDCLLVLELAEESLSKKSTAAFGVDLVEIRKIARDLAEALTTSTPGTDPRRHQALERGPH